MSVSRYGSYANNEQNADQGKGYVETTHDTGKSFRLSGRYFLLDVLSGGRRALCHKEA